MTTAPTNHVDRCVCFNVTFEQLKRHVDQHHCGIEALRERFKCGHGCGLCMPYIRDMLETGQTSFPVKSPTAIHSRL